MIKILFVCHGNICRSPMAEYIFRNYVEQQGYGDSFEIASAAATREDLGSPIYPPAKRLLNAHGISCDEKRARLMTSEDYAYYDYLIGMDEENRYHMMRKYMDDPDHKISLLLDFTNHPREISDPWYNGNFEQVYAEIEEGSEALLNYLIDKGLV